MAPRYTSQWDFGELFPEEELRRVLTVSQLTLQVRQLLEERIGRVWVSGEVSNLRVQASGHCYFTLKDARAQIACVLFRGQVCPGRDLLEDNRQVVVQGDLTVYEPRGQYQLRVLAVEVQGMGALQLAFERLKARLQAEGLFAPERKRPLPPRPRCLGIVTSPTAAALQDVLHVLERRFPALELILAPCRVQGEGAAQEIAAAIAALNEWAATAPPRLRPDLILLTRGGGSLEDLWAFNEEIVARAIVASKLPVVSAVGHEIDFTIADFAADVRAATPSAAAELITEQLVADRRALEELAWRLRQRTRAGVETWRDRLEQLAARLERAHPRRQIEQWSQRADELLAALQLAARNGWRHWAARFATARARWQAVRPAARLQEARQRLDALERRLRFGVRQSLQHHQAALAQLRGRWELLSPEATLARGYSITRDAATGRLIRSVSQIEPGAEVETRVRDGLFRSTVSGPVDALRTPTDPGDDQSPPADGRGSPSAR
ncbi:MAG: exodeoxyribonuclease VII large subunit [Verrucomicrobia bacterium]|nr:MAG: exodeoxyribonuclease VII large subunit [Verrucomicrobiota bacterium]